MFNEINTRMASIGTAINGDATVGGRNEPVPMPIANRAAVIYNAIAFAQSPVAGLYRESYQIAASELSAALASLRVLAADLATLESALEVKGAPWTPGRIPEWQDD